MQRIKYVKIKDSKVNGIGCIILDIYARKIVVSIIPARGKLIQTMIHSENKTRYYDCTSLQNAKRKVRKILKEEFEVNLQDEVRSKLCF